MHRISVRIIRMNHMVLGADHFVVRRGGKLCVLVLDDENTVDMKTGIQKRLSISSRTVSNGEIQGSSRLDFEGNDSDTG